LIKKIFVNLQRDSFRSPIMGRGWDTKDIF